MGVSTDALLVYGYVWDDETDLLGSEDDGDHAWEEIIAKRRGLTDPWASHPGGHRPDWVEAHRAEIDAWNEAKKAIEIEYGVEIDQHGSDQWSVPIIKITGAGYRARRGYPQKLVTRDLIADPDWDAKLQRFITDLNIDTSEAKGPGWFLYLGYLPGR